VRTVLFRDDLIDKILAGEKTVTRRSWRPKEGKTYSLVSNRKRGEIKVVKVYRQRLGNMTEEDAYKEGFPSLLVFKAYCVNVLKWEWNPDLTVNVVEFQVLRRVHQV